MSQTTSRLLQWLPFAAGILPLIAMFAAFWLGVRAEVLPDCNPIIDGCRSISAAGRQPPGSFLFRIIMLSQGVLLWFVWYLGARWLEAVKPDTRTMTLRVILLFGLMNAVALAVYVTFLGTKEPIYEFMRRFGIYFTFIGAGVAQLTIAIALLRTRYAGLARVMLGTCIAVYVLGIANLVFKSMLDDPDPMENRIEWIASILIQGWFFLLFAAWRRSGAGFSVRVREA